jgi:hypothetical protein
MCENTRRQGRRKETGEEESEHTSNMGTTYSACSECMCRTSHTISSRLSSVLSLEVGIGSVPSASCLEFLLPMVLACVKQKQKKQKKKSKTDTGVVVS